MPSCRALEVSQRLLVRGRRFVQRILRRSHIAKLITQPLELLNCVSMALLPCIKRSRLYRPIFLDNPLLSKVRHQRLAHERQTPGPRHQPPG